MWTVIVGIPAYQAERTIGKVIKDIIHHLDGWAKLRILVVDDGSTDKTSEIASSINKKSNQLFVTVHKHKTNLGYGAAIRTLFTEARPLLEYGDYFVTMDSDGQHLAKDIPALVSELQDSDADISIGSRFLDPAKNKIPRVRRLGIGAITKSTNKTFGTKFTDAQCGFRAYTKVSVEALHNKLTVDGMGLSVEVLSLALQFGLKIVEVPVDCRYDTETQSSQGKLTHGADVLGALFQFVLERGAKWIFVVGLLFALLSMWFGIELVLLYNRTHIFILSYGLLMLYSTMVSLILILASINVYSIRRMKELLRLGK